jgi:hypothetical protein
MSICYPTTQQLRDEDGDSLNPLNIAANKWLHSLTFEEQAAYATHLGVDPESREFDEDMVTLFRETWERYERDPELRDVEPILSAETAAYFKENTK